jgi:outer membrane lipoprotein SlyB
MFSLNQLQRSGIGKRISNMTRPEHSMRLAMPTMASLIRTVAGLWAVFVITGCAQQPIIDTKGVNMAQYNQDLADCQTYADQVLVGRKALGGAAAGAVVGAAIGAAVGNSDTAQRAAGVGAVAGAGKGTGRGLQEKQQVIRNCLRNRGYAVLN